MRKLRHIFSAAALCILTLLFIVFAVANRDVLELSFFPIPYAVEMPKFLFALLCFSLGLLVGATALTMRSAGQKHQLRRELRRAKAMENELKALRMEGSDRSPARLP
jgi:uncharacterized integral membrane protein